MKNSENKGQIIIYKASDGPELQIKLENETLWLNLQQMADLFQRDKSVISRHIKGIYQEAELSRNSTVAFFATVQTEGNREVHREIEYYNLDMIISVGYRVNSKRGTQFRIWATRILREYMLKGYLINEKRLKANEVLKLQDLQSAVVLMQQALDAKRLVGYEKDLLKIITDYANTWLTLYQYDADELPEEGAKKSAEHLDHAEVKKMIDRFRTRLMREQEASELFGQEVSGKLEALLGNIKQTFGGKDVYPTLDEKAAHLLYFTVKNHPFVDGNKRIGALLFILFLVQNRYLHNKRGERKINDSALTAITLLVAESKPAQKETMIKVIVNLINKK